MREIHFVGGPRDGKSIDTPDTFSEIGVLVDDELLDPGCGSYQSITVEVVTYKRVWTGPCGREVFVPEDWL